MPVYQSVAIILGAIVAVLTAVGTVLNVPRLASEASRRGRIARRIEHLDRLVAFTDDESAKGGYTKQRSELAADLAATAAIRATPATRLFIKLPFLFFVATVALWTVLLAANPKSDSGISLRSEVAKVQGIGLATRFEHNSVWFVVTIIVAVLICTPIIVYLSFSLTARLERLQANRTLYRKLGFPEPFARLPEPGFWSTITFNSTDQAWVEAILKESTERVRASWPQSNRSTRNSETLQRIESMRIQVACHDLVSTIRATQAAKPWWRR